MRLIQKYVSFKKLEESFSKSNTILNSSKRPRDEQRILSSVAKSQVQLYSHIKEVQPKKIEFLKFLDRVLASGEKWT